jgi:membrane protein DedA with SNARE-associated domain
MKEWIVQIVESSGYGGLALLMFLENIFPPIPSELIMPLGGFAAAQGKMTFPLVILAGTIGSVIGQLPLYYLGNFLGKKRLMHLADRYGKWLAISGDDIDKSMGWFSRHGGRAVLLCRLVPGVRSFISIPAGICGMALPRFLFYSFIGMGVWASILGYAGYALGQNYERVEHYIGPVSYVVFGGLAIALIIWVIRRKRNPPAPRTPRATSDAEDDCHARA